MSIGIAARGAPRSGLAVRGAPRLWLVLLGAVWVVASCATALPVPVLGEATGPQGLRLQVLRLPWTGEPHDLPVYFVSVPVDLQNRGPVPIDIHPQDFSLVDRQGLAVVACTMDEAVRALVPMAQPRTGPMLRGYPGGPSMSSTRPQTSPESEPVLEGSSVPPPVSDPERLALPQGPLRPGASVRGYLYFHLQDPARRQHVLLHWQQSGALEAAPLVVPLVQVQ